MKRKVVITFFGVCLIYLNIRAQQNVGIGTTTPHASAVLDVRSNNKGLLIPRISLTSETDVTTIPGPPISLLVYNFNGALPDGEGFYFWSGGKWSKLATRLNIDNLTWGTKGNSGINPATDFIGTIDNKSLVFKTNNIESGRIDPQQRNVFFGRGAGILATGSNNSFFGHDAGNANTIGNFNVFLGHEAGKLNITGARNTFVGKDAGANNTIGNENTFIGHGAGRFLTGNNIIAIGKDAFGGNNASPKSHSIAIGDYAGFNNTISTVPSPTIFIGHAAGYNGSSGIAIGDSAAFNFSDYRNIAIGVNALKNNGTGVLDIAIGFDALENNTNGVYNLALGQFAMTDNTTGSHNVAIGNNALQTNTVGEYNTAIGADAGSIFSTILINTTALGNQAKVSTSNTMVFGNGDVNRWAFGRNTTAGSNALQVGDNNTNGNGAFLTQGGVWTNTSSRIKKEDFSDIDGLDLLKKIQQMPVRKWKYKGTNEYHIGPVAEDFYKLFGLGVDNKGISTVDPSGIALAAIQEQQKTIQKQNEQILQMNEKVLQMQTEITQLKKLVIQTK